MTFRKRMVADLLFGVQAVCAAIFGGAQFVRMLSSTEGVSITWFCFWEIFLVLNLALAWKAHKNLPSRVTLQTIWSYTIWTIMAGADLVLVVFKGTWDHYDTLTASVVLIGGGTVLVAATRNGWGIADPFVKAFLAVFFKSAPQLTLALKIYEVGGAGLAAVTIVAGHITVWMRIGQLWFSIHEAGWDRNRIGMAISEISNETSWTIATIVWLTR